MVNRLAILRNFVDRLPMWQKILRLVALGSLTVFSAVIVLLGVLIYTTFPAANMSEQLGHWGAVLCWRGTIHLLDVVEVDDQNTLTDV